MATEMINLSVEISDIMSYDIKIAKEITSKTFPEVMRRLKAINNLLPKEVILKTEVKEEVKEETTEEEIKEEEIPYIPEHVVEHQMPKRKIGRALCRERV